MVGAVVMVHGDDQGLILPPKLAPYQVVIVPIWHDEGEKAQVLPTVETITGQFGEAVRFKVDDREEYSSPGWKFNDWEMRGVPLRIEVGPKDVAKGQVVLARRDVAGREGKSSAPMEGLLGRVQEMLDEIQVNLFAKALKFRDDNTTEPADYEEFKVAVERPRLLSAAFPSIKMGRKATVSAAATKLQRKRSLPERIDAASAPVGFAALLRHRQSGGPATGLQIQPERM
jgi:prolyl-tRNA synthetase